MKLSTIAKTSLALGILTTGVMTTYAQPTDAEVKQGTQTKSDSEDINKLHSYYTQTPYELKGKSGYRVNDIVNVVDSPQLTEVKLAGSDKSKFNDNNLSNIDVFVVREDSKRDGTNRSIGGITQGTNVHYTDWVKNPVISLKRTVNNAKLDEFAGYFKINKKEITLKELDFKLRNQLINKNGLYKDGIKNGDIIIKMKGNSDENRYTFELHKKLQEHRMGDVIDATQIDRIDVEYK
ncbi:exotoxin beta-grasp domain-containing protein [Staphylococcus agnetis]|uniref:exotoxin beta-grasp domain-containing protein n=1 Tax=Staphylococcus agnetis TaxID=985762 RepID=UPI00143081AE|nr:exotoxin beta-grasp domain-containing protein [Staphylococcus agnetis]NJH83429.1 superantigen-like protein [Staphylococcus agnetis]